MEEALRNNEVSEHFFDKKRHWKIAPAEWHTHPRKHFEQKEFGDALKQYLAQLHRRLHDVFILRELEGQDAKEICKTLNITPTNLWVMLYRARMKLKTCLEKNRLRLENVQDKHA